MLQAVIFDFDGTLIDSAPEIGAALNALLARLGRPALGDAWVRGTIGNGAPNLLRHAFAATGEPLASADEPAILAEYLDILLAGETDADCVYPGVFETLDGLAARGLGLGLCTNKPGAATRLVLDQIGLGSTFGAIATGDSLPYRKPDPRPLAWVIERLGVPVDGTVKVGDSANDVAVARAIGIPVVAVSYGYPRMPVAELGADIVIDRFADLPAALAGLADR